MGFNSWKLYAGELWMSWRFDGVLSALPGLVPTALTVRVQRRRLHLSVTYALAGFDDEYEDDTPSESNLSTIWQRPR